MVSLTTAESVANPTPDRLKPVRVWLSVMALMVLAMVVVIAIFFLIVDQILAFGIKTILGIGG